ncbi:MAG: flagellar protein [Sphingobium sp. 32-64-5]|nr:MAG: flagellar protein [Sphingobium sp. 32-64-5]
MARLAATSLAFLALLPGGPALAQQKFENLDRIDSLVAMTVGATIGQPGGASAPVDRRLRLAACPTMPEVTGPAFGAAIVQCQAIGWRIRVPLRLDQAASAAMGATVGRSAAYGRAAMPARSKEVIIKRGDPVQLVAGGAAFTVSRQMIADEDGAAGDLIRVRNDSRSDPVLAQIMENGIVRVPGFKDY